MAYFNIKEFKFLPRPIPEQPSYTPPNVPTPEPTEEGSTPIIVTPTFSGDTSIVLYVTQDEKNKVAKTLGNALNFDISIKENVSVITPTIILDTNVDLSYYNYMYITSVQRYYFIDNVEMLQGGHFKIYCSCDVLMSFKKYLLNITGIVSETETSKIINKNLPNKHYVNSSGKNIKILKFEMPRGKTGFVKNPHRILVCSGKYDKIVPPTE